MNERDVLVRTALAQVRWFADWAPDSLDALCRAAQVVHYRAGSRIYGEGDRLDGIYVLASGSIRYVAQQPNGKAVPMRFWPPGEPLGVVACLDGKGSPLDLYAHQDTAVVFVPRAALLEAMRGDFAAAWSMVQLLCARSRDMFTKIESQLTLPLRARLAQLFLHLARGFGAAEPEGVSIPLKLTQDEIGSMLGVSRQSVHGEIKALEREGIIEMSYGHVTLRDPAGLERVAQGGHTAS